MTDAAPMTPRRISLHTAIIGGSIFGAIGPLVQAMAASQGFYFRRFFIGPLRVELTTIFDAFWPTSILLAMSSESRMPVVWRNLVSAGSYAANIALYGAVGALIWYGLYRRRTILWLSGFVIVTWWLMAFSGSGDTARHWLVLNLGF